MSDKQVTSTSPDGTPGGVTTAQAANWTGDTTATTTESQAARLSRSGRAEAWRR